MITAIYARKSTEQTGVGDEEKSVTRQIEQAKAYADQKGWTVPNEFIFVDDGISGAEFVKRPGFIRLMNALKPKPAFQFLIMSEESRLGREQIETAYALKQITDAGVRVFFYLEDRERTLETPLEKMMMALGGFASEMERERAKQRTYDAMMRKAKAGHVTGGKVFGYDNREVLSAEGNRLHVLRVVNPTEAAIIRNIFEMYASGLGITRIAKHLNAEGVPAPRQSPRGWAPTAVREMLRRPIYRGEIVWNEHEKIVRGGTKKRRRRAEKDWIRLDAPELRIIAPDLWEPVQARLARTSDQSRPRVRDVDSKYLLTGMARCAQCGGPMTVVGQDYHRRKGRYYVCAYHKKRGSSICKNSLLAEQEMLDAVLLKALTDVLHEKVLNQAIEQALNQLRTQQGSQLDRRTEIERELSLIEAQEIRLVDAIAEGEHRDPLLAKLNREGARKKALAEELDRLDRNGPTELDTARLKREMKTRLADTQTLLGSHISESRKILRLLFEEPIQCQAVMEGKQSRYVLSGTGNFLNLLPSSAAALNVVSPTGSSACFRRSNIGQFRSVALQHKAILGAGLRGLLRPTPTSHDSTRTTNQESRHEDLFPRCDGWIDFDRNARGSRQSVRSCRQSRGTAGLSSAIRLLPAAGPAARYRAPTEAGRSRPAESGGEAVREMINPDEHPGNADWLKGQPAKDPFERYRERFGEYPPTHGIPESQWPAFLKRVERAIETGQPIELDIPEGADA